MWVTVFSRFQSENDADREQSFIGENTGHAYDLEWNVLDVEEYKYKDENGTVVSKNIE